MVAAERVDPVIRSSRYCVGTSFFFLPSACTVAVADPLVLFSFVQ